MQIDLTVQSVGYVPLSTPRQQGFESEKITSKIANPESANASFGALGDQVLAGSTMFVYEGVVYTVSEDSNTISGLTGGGGVTAQAGNAVSGVSVATENLGVHKTVLTLTDAIVTITDDAGVAQYGGIEIYDFPEGAINISGAVVSGTLTGGVTGTITNTWGGGFALGTEVATTGADLIGTEADILSEVNIAAAVAKVGTVSGKGVALVSLDGTTTPKKVFLNFVIDDSASHTSGTAKFTGTVTLTWANLGDL